MNPLRLAVSVSTWRSLSYLAGSLLLGALWFTVALSLVLTSSVLAICWIGLPALAVSLAAVRGLADVERRRCAAYRGAPIPRPYREIASGNLRSTLLARLRDPATCRDLLLLVVLWPLLFVLDTVALTVWVALVATVTLPIWYRYVPQDFDNGTTAHGVQFGYFPNGPNGGHSWGFFVGDQGSAFVAAAVALVVWVLAGNYLLVGAARVHAAISAGLLRPSVDPLAAAREMLRTPALRS